jgi:hypothetical protein
MRNTIIKKNRYNNHESGVALVMALFVLLVLTAIGAALMYLTNTETQINYNYRNDEVAYFAARAGIEEARDRMTASTLTLPPADGSKVVYLLNPAGASDTVAPWDPTNQYVDDEICHDGYAFISGGTISSDVRCSAPPSGNGWYITPSPTSTLKWNNTTTALPFKWVRIGVKLNGSVQNYTVDSTKPSASPVCWNGQGGGGEVVLTAASCAAMAPAMTPVYLITSLAVSSTGARKIVQSEVAPSPAQPFPYGLFGTGTTCGTVVFTGNGQTDSFSSKDGGYANTHKQTGGDVGANGGVSLTGNAKIGGSVGVTTPGNSPVTEGNCPGSNYTTSGGSGLVTDPNNQLVPISAQTFPVPPAPVPTPPTGSVKIPNCNCLTPNTYGDISISGQNNLTLAPGVYNINSLSISGQGSVTISPPGQVVLNVAGQGGTVVSISGNGVNNPTLIANNFQINYAGTDSLSVSGNGNSYYIVDAPNANVNITGNGDIFGAIVGKTINDNGNGTFHYDTSVSLGPPSLGVLQQVSFRHISY